MLLCLNIAMNDLSTSGRNITGELGCERTSKIFNPLFDYREQVPQ